MYFTYLPLSAMLLATAQAAPGFLQSSIFSAPKESHPHADGDICLKVCWPETPACPTEWKPKNYGTDYQPCWTCCKSYDEDSKHAKIDSTSQSSKVEDISIDIHFGNDHLTTQQQICWLACFGDEPSCPSGWEAKSFGSGSDLCWTCCRSEEDVVQNVQTKQSKHSQGKTRAHDNSKNDVSVAVNVNDEVSAQSDVCLMVCWYQEPDACPEGWSSKNLGVEDQPCWTCCKSYSEDNFESKKIKHELEM